MSALPPKADIQTAPPICLLMTLSGRRPHGVAFALSFLFHVRGYFWLGTPFLPHFPIGGLYTAGVGGRVTNRGSGHPLSQGLP